MTVHGGLVEALESMLATLPEDFELAAVLDDLCVAACDLLAVDAAALHLADDASGLTPTELADMSSVAGVPVWGRGEVLGVLELFRRQPAPFSQDDLANAEVLATAAGTCISLSRRRDQVAALVDQLQRALSSRIQIEQAKGVVAERLGLPVDVAFELLRDHARNRNLRLTEVAEAVLTGDPAVASRAPPAHRRASGAP